jgi:hypothetical protein
MKSCPKQPDGQRDRLTLICSCSKAFSSEMDTGSREENAINKDPETFSYSMGSENALAARAALPGVER